MTAVIKHLKFRVLEFWRNCVCFMSAPLCDLNLGTIIKSKATVYKSNDQSINLNVSHIHFTGYLHRLHFYTSTLVFVFNYVFQK